jgi:zinc transport system substrate-binding protein
MNRKNIILQIFILLFYFSCTEIKQSDKLTVIATLFPEYDFAKQIAKDKAGVRLLLPPGVEAHSYEPAPRDIADIKNANIFIYTSEFMEPWATKLAGIINNSSLIIIEAGAGMKINGPAESSHESGIVKHDDHDHSAQDPHIWVNPVFAQKMADNILAGFIKADPKNKIFYRTNADTLIKEINKLDKDFIKLFKTIKNKTIIHGGHFTFGYFAKRYGLKYISPYKGFSPDAEPSPQKIGELIKTIKSTGSKTIYYEELIDPKATKVIAGETGVKMLLLHGAHNVSKEELDSGASYISIMRGNLERLKEGLN